MPGANDSPGTWLFLDSGAGDPAWNMAMDEALLEAAPDLSAPVLRLYGWTEPAATFGYSQRYEDLAKATLLRPLIRRPTGGGLVPHDADWTYSLVFPPGHFWYGWRAEESYRRVHEWVRDSLARLGVGTELAPCCRKEIPGQCFFGAEKHDVLWHGRKIAGAAQRRPKSGLLIQGSVLPPPLGLSRRAWHEAMLATGAEILGGPWQSLVPPANIDNRAKVLRASKYSRPEHNRKR
jgi:lipoate-protein ligase A